MSITIGSSSAVQTNTESAQAILTAKKAQTQQEIEGQMALKLIESANPETAAMPAVGNSGHNINIKA
ncbi:cytoplasmic protein [Thalassotalea sp. G2M2-11]|uniref:cytoplasmic protein n=1 Tax=Thalassotalea sp. G2M2-11 TaxID=2787627 RepID=UPI0019D2DAD3|nr:cytoplasmic protein [Thalassotalea sp. G2M2-11]